VTDGVFDAADVTVGSVTGDDIAAFVIYLDSGTEATSTLRLLRHGQLQRRHSAHSQRERCAGDLGRCRDLDAVVTGGRLDLTAAEGSCRRRSRDDRRPGPGLGCRRIRPLDRRPALRCRVRAAHPRRVDDTRPLGLGLRAALSAPAERPRRVRLAGSNHDGGGQNG
jgi:hypothetical protein